MSTNPTEQLATFAAELTLAQVPETVRVRAKEVILDTIASALAGRISGDTPRVEAVARRLFGPGKSTILGGSALAPLGAVLVNGYQVNGFTICDAYTPLKAHLTPSVVPPALALAEEQDRPGEALLTAIVAGLEVMVRVGRGLVYETYRSRGWHAPGVVGPFGAAAAAGNLLGLRTGVVIDAFGLAGSQSAGTYAGWGTPQMKFQQARSGVSGLLACTLAAEGYHGGGGALTHEDGGLLGTYSDGGDPEQLTAGLGSQWEFTSVTLKRYPVAFQLQAIVMATLELARRLDVGRVSRVRVRISPDVHDEFAGIGWEDEFRSHISPQYLTAVVLQDNKCWVEQFKPERFEEPAVGELASSVVVEADPGIPGIGAIVEVTTEDGEVHSETCLRPLGHPDSPLTHNDLLAKLNDSREGILDDARTGQLIEQLDHLERLESTSTMMEGLRSRAT